MFRILDYRGQEATRSATVQSIRDLKQNGRQLVQVTAGTTDEAAAAEAAGIEMVVTMAQAVVAVRAGAPSAFVTAAIDFGGEVSVDDTLRSALDALSNGADAVITARGMSCVERLAEEDIPVMGHLGFVPKKSTLYGGVRAVGKTAVEAVDLWGRFQRLEDAGAFAVECELIPANVMAEINRRTGLATISLGSGADADVIFLFTTDICGEGDRIPRHARSYADLHSLHRQMDTERRRALREFREDVAGGRFPAAAELVVAPDRELAGFLEAITAEEQ